MANIINNRIYKELQRVAAGKSDDITLALVNESNLRKLIGSFIGFDNTPYAEGRYEIDIEIPDQYPFKPPTCKFITPVWHPNISSVSGYICLDLLREGKWAAALSMENVLTSIKALLILAQPDDPQDAVVASQFVQKRSLFEQTASYWNHEFGKGPRFDYFDEMDVKVKSMVEKGSTRFQAIHQLSMNDWNL